MPTPLQPFLISEFKTGINTYLEPWIRPQDAFEPLVNAYVYRGTVNKRAGYSQYGNTLSTEKLVITGISMAASAVVTAVNNFTVADYGVTTVTFSAVVGMVEINGLTGTVQSSTSSQFTVNINSSAFTAYASGGVATYTLLAGRPVMGIMRYIDETTGAISLVVATTTNLYLYDPGTGNYNSIVLPVNFTGNITNFFNWTNWQASPGATSYLYMTNNKDNVTRFDGTGASALVPVIDGTGQTITKALDVVVYKQRLLLIRPTLSTDGTQNQSIYWSAVQNDALWRVDIAGEGGNLDAPTGDIIMATKFIRDVLVVFFTNSTWIFRYTGNDSAPFRWDKVNNSKSTNAPYGAVSYDERSTSIGNTGLIACDGVNVQRYDVPIIDYYETNFSQQYYAQSFSQRYDNLNQSWTLYVSNDRDPTNFPLVGNIAPGSDSALVYNFLENTWATYTWSRPLTCLGLFYNQSGTTWADLTVAVKNEWQNTDFPWNSYSSQKGAPILLAGDTTGHVYHMDDSDSVTDNGTSIVPDIVTTRWNPLLSLGQKVQFSYIDIYYLVSSVDPNDPIAVTLNFYVDNSNNVAASRTLTLDGPSDAVTQTIGTGNGGSTYSSTITLLGGYILPYSFEVTVTTSDGVEDFDDNGSGVLIGSLGDTGTINYNTGAWTLALTGRTIPTGNGIVATYQFNNPSSAAFKRIYLNLIGEFFQMEIDPSVDSYLQFNGFIIWARPAGRMTPF